MVEIDDSGRASVQTGELRLSVPRRRSRRCSGCARAKPAVDILDAPVLFRGRCRVPCPHRSMFAGPA